MAPIMDFTNFSASIVTFIEDYGWYFLAFIVVLVYVYKKYFVHMLIRYRKSRDEAEYAAKYHKNPDLLQSRLSAQQLHVEKLQQKYNQEADVFKKKQEEKMERKRQEAMEKLANVDVGHKLSNKDKNGSFRPDYNPLMGNAGGSSYRAPKRSACGGGGCGK